MEAFSEGTPRIDRYGAETEDKVDFRGHQYSNKAPGLALASFLPFQVLEAFGVPERARREAAERGDRDPVRESGEIWTLGLFAVALPTFGLLLLVRRVGEGLEPGYGAVASVTAGVGTLLLRRPERAQTSPPPAFGRASASRKSSPPGSLGPDRTP